jgi:hypothetical protein
VTTVITAGEITSTNRRQLRKLGGTFGRERFPHRMIGSSQAELVFPAEFPPPQS